MTKLIIDLDKLPDDLCLYRTKEEWDNSYYSRATHENNMATRERIRIRNGTAAHVPINTDVADSEPDKFPCLAIQGNMRSNPNGPDEITYLFIYDFTIEGDKE